MLFHREHLGVRGGQRGTGLLGPVARQKPQDRLCAFHRIPGAMAYCFMETYRV